MCSGNASCEPASSLSSMLVLEEVSEPFEIFVCQICLDILYKPIVQACGHVFCFWCVRRSMKQNKPSQCPVCRQPYIHFPRVCQLLHFFLTKAWPEDYKRKANEIQAMEESTKIFSPRILSPNTPTMLSLSPILACDHHWTGTPRTNRNYWPILLELETKPTENLLNINMTQQLEVQMINIEDQYLEQSSISESKKHEITTETANEASIEITIEDLSCICCRKLLYRPVVLNCGEVLCESCWEEMRLASCPSCRSVHPSGPLGVCLTLDHYLEKAFPLQYSQRKEEVEAQSARQQHTPLLALRVDPETDVDDIGDKCGYVHIGVGCDGCGMFPIVGHRYHCTDCREQVGYDLCGSCYTNNASSSHPIGRFNQEHSLEHHMEERVSNRRSAPGLFNEVVQYLNVAPLNLNLDNGIISRRRQQDILDDFDDYIDSFV